MKPNTIFVDSEISSEDGRIKDLGAISSNGDQFHSTNKSEKDLPVVPQSI